MPVELRPDFFVSDLHLTADREKVTQIFLHFLRDHAVAAGRLFILGDLFEHWLGDDDAAEPSHARVLEALATLAEHGCAVHFMHGNRDFLMGETSLAAMRGQRIVDPSVVQVGATRTLLAHGDAYCTDDADYQAFRANVRSQAWQQAFLSKPLPERRRLVAEMRARSEAEKQRKPAAIMDVNPQAIENALREHACTLMIHGHTHRPARHHLVLDGTPCERWVLAAWEAQGSYLRCDELGCRSVSIA